MKQDLELKIQAFVDGELAARDRKAVESLIERDGEAKALFEELSLVHSILSGNEPEMVLPESREFFWSKIEQGIEAAEKAPTRERREGLPWWVRVLAPAGLAAALVAVLALAPHAPQGSNELAQTSIDMPVGTVTFYAPEEEMTIVWVDTGVN